MRIPPSLVNILAEVKYSMASSVVASPHNEASLSLPPKPGAEGDATADSAGTSFEGDLTRWAKQGVLLINTTMTVRHARPISHAPTGWCLFVGALIAAIAKRDRRVAFMYWGRHARHCGECPDPRRHRVLYASHPSPRSSAGFMGRKHFSKVNDFLRAHYPSEPPIEW